MSTIKIVISHPTEAIALTHGARAICAEYIRAFNRDNPEFILELFVPEDADGQQFESLSTVSVPTSKSGWQQLRFEQIELPKMVKESNADVLVMPYEAAPLVCSVPVFMIGLLAGRMGAHGFAHRLVQASRRAGVQGAEKRIAYRDLKTGSLEMADVDIVDPWVSKQFSALSQSEDKDIATRHELPYSYVLAHGVSLLDVPVLLASWTWVDGSVGDSVPLVAIVSEGIEKQTWEKHVEQMRLSHSVRLLSEVGFAYLPALYRRSEALLQGGQAVEHQIMRWAMACGLPVTGFEVPNAASVLGSAGYLVDPGDTRALGAACLTVIVESEVKERMRQAGLVRASAFHTSKRPTDLGHEITGADNNSIGLS